MTSRPHTTLRRDLRVITIWLQPSFVLTTQYILVCDSFRIVVIISAHMIIIYHREEDVWSDSPPEGPMGLL